MERKAKELKVKLADWKKESKMHEKRKLKTSTNHTRSDMELAKVLNVHFYHNHSGDRGS